VKGFEEKKVKKTHLGSREVDEDLRRRRRGRHLLRCGRGSLCGARARRRAVLVRLLSLLVCLDELARFPRVRLCLVLATARVVVEEMHLEASIRRADGLGGGVALLGIVVVVVVRALVHGAALRHARPHGQVSCVRHLIVLAAVLGVLAARFFGGGGEWSEKRPRRDESRVLNGALTKPRRRH